MSHGERGIAGRAGPHAGGRGEAAAGAGSGVAPSDSACCGMKAVLTCPARKAGSRRARASQDALVATPVDAHVFDGADERSSAASRDSP